MRLARKVVVYELRIWQSLFLWLLRRPRVPAGADAFPYASLLTPILVAFIVVSALEIPVVHFFLPWEAVRTAFLLLGVWGVIWMVGLLASMRIYPHLVGPAGLRVRYSFGVDVLLPWESIAEIRAQRRALASGRKVQLERTDAGTTLHVALSSTTNVEVALREPTEVRLPKGAETIVRLHFYADDPRALVARAREHLVRSDAPAA
jgi:hypothetical protein